MHSYVEKVNKLDQDGRVIVSFSGLASLSKKFAKEILDTPPVFHNQEDLAQGASASVDKLNRSQEIECINELDSENEFSYMEAIGDEDKSLSIRMLKHSTSSVRGFTEASRDAAPLNASQIHIKRLSNQVKLGEEEKTSNAAQKQRKMTDQFTAKSPMHRPGHKKVSQIGFKASHSGVKQTAV